MDQNEDPGDLERKIQQATRIASRVNDQTTVERLRAWIEDMKQNLRQRREARRTKQAISARAREIWEQNGCPADRDLGFWLQAESEISERHRESSTASVLTAGEKEMNSFWRHVKHELSDERHATLILAVFAGFTAWIITHFLRGVFG